MSNSISNNTLTQDLYWQEEGIEVSTGENSKLSQEDFFSLLTEQLSMQDPTKPVDNDQMIAQMTSFTMAESLTELNTSFDTFAEAMTSNQALQASSLIGQTVLVEGNLGHLEDDGELAAMVITSENVDDLTVTIENEIGQVVRTMKLGDQDAGNIQVNWNGVDDSGNSMPSGNYYISATAEVNGEGTELATATYQQVNSVSLASSTQGVILNLQNDSVIELSSVLEIGG